MGWMSTSRSAFTRCAQALCLAERHVRVVEAWRESNVPFLRVSCPQLACVIGCIMLRPVGMGITCTQCYSFCGWYALHVYRAPARSASIWAFKSCNTCSLLRRCASSPSTCSLTIAISSLNDLRLCPLFALPSPFSRSRNSRLL